jgi:ABC-type Mn2+/Zn2+ transport system permease subunit
MSTSERTLPTTRPQPWIPRLVVGNVVVALIGALLTSFASGSMSPWLTSWRAIFFGLVFGQASLLGIWGALGQNPWWVRLMGVSPGAVAYTIRDRLNGSFRIAGSRRVRL